MSEIGLGNLTIASLVKVAISSFPMQKPETKQHNIAIV